jgi:hypothetical protein
LVEIEDWNEYGELKQHVTMYYDEFTTPSKAAGSKSTAPTPSGTPSKPPGSQKENVKLVTTPAAEAPKDVEQSKSITGGQPSSLTLAMRQAGQEAAQKAKEGKKKATETFVGVGKAEPEPEKKEDKITPPPIVVEPQHTIETTTLLQSPTSTAWKQEIHAKAETPRPTVKKLESLQSPTTTAWKLADTDLPITTYRGSNVEEVSAECIKQVEEDEMIPEEDEDAVED